MPGAEHKMARGILILIKFRSFITCCIEYLCSNTALLAASACSSFSIMLYSFQIIPPMLKVKSGKKRTLISCKKSQHIWHFRSPSIWVNRWSNYTKSKQANSDEDLKINRDFCATGAAELMQQNPGRRYVSPPVMPGSFSWALQGCPSPACTTTCTCLGRAMPSRSGPVLCCSHSHWTACLPVSLQPVT